MRARLALLLAAVAVPPATLAQPAAPGDTGLVLAARGGYGAPFGEIDRDGIAVKDVVERKLPIWIELGYRFNRRVQGELYLEIAPASVGDAYCAANVSCSASNVRFGLAMQLHLAPGATFDPWIAVGFGVEVLNARIYDPDPLAPPGRYEWSWAGVELPLLEAGVDFAVSPRFALGPYVSVSFAQFTSFSERPIGGSTTSGAIDDREVHGWIELGLKGTLRL